MNLEESFQQAITHIQETFCRPCKYGKCLITIKSFLDETQIPESGAESPTPEPGSGKGKMNPVKTAAKTSAEKACKKCLKVKPLDDSIPPVEPDEDGMYICPMRGCSMELTSREAYENHYRMRHFGKRTAA